MGKYVDGGKVIVNANIKLTLDASQFDASGESESAIKDEIEAGLKKYAESSLSSMMKEADDYEVDSVGVKFSDLTFNDAG